MSTSYGERTLAFPQRQATLTAAGLIAAALMGGTAALAILASERGTPSSGAGSTLPIQRPAAHGEMEYPGIEALATRQTGSGLRLRTPKGGFAEFAGLEPAAAALGQAHGREEEYAGIR